jgi:hypothetical protein
LYDTDFSAEINVTMTLTANYRPLPEAIVAVKKHCIDHGFSVKAATCPAKTFHANRVDTFVPLPKQVIQPDQERFCPSP